MEYYRIVQVTGWRNIIHPKFPTVSQIWGEEKPMFVEGTVERPDEEVQFLSFYQSTILSGAFLVSKKMGAIWKEYQLGGRYRPCVLGHLKNKKIQSYDFMYPRLLPALHKDTPYYADGNPEELVLTEEMIGAHKVFGVKGKTMTYLIVAADVLDRMLQSKLTGFEFTPIKTREGMPWQKSM